MRLKTDRLGNARGIALSMTALVVTSLLVLLNGFTVVSLNQNRSVDIFARRARAYYIASSGLDRAIYWLRSQEAPPVGDATNPWGGVQNLGSGSYSVTIADLGPVGGQGSSVRRYRVTSSGTFGSTTRTLANYVQVDSYARYLWFTNGEVFNGSNVWFWTQDSLSGSTHTNGHLNIYGNPYFGSDVSSVDDYIKYYNNGNSINSSNLSNAPHDNPTFTEGVDFGAEPVVMPSQALNLRSAASSGGLTLSGSSTVVLNNDGTMTVTNAKKGWTNHTVALPANGALFVTKGTLTLSGTLNGRLTAGASQDVIIPNNLTYAVDPRLDPSSDDVLGIISEADVVIDDSAPANLEIDACIMALDTSFMLENWNVGPPKGTLTVYGGIIQDERGPVGTFNSSSGTKLSGYSKQYLYDSRLVAGPPPFMPTTGDYVSLSWEEN